MMRNLIVVVAWHGESPKVSTSCIEPRGNTFFPREPPQMSVDRFQFLPSNAHFIKG